MPTIDLRALRQQAGLKQADLAERLQIDRSYLSRIEAGERRPDLELAQRYVEACGAHLVIVDNLLDAGILGAKLEDRLMLSRLARVVERLHPGQRRDLETLIAAWERQEVLTASS